MCVCVQTQLFVSMELNFEVTKGKQLLSTTVSKIILTFFEHNSDDILTSY